MQVAIKPLLEYQISGIGEMRGLVELRKPVIAPTGGLTAHEAIN
ncbi:MULTISPECIES: hypothetical protein [unclassified Ruegeria]|nr:MULTISPECIES: hypothetical protein [unclassified Ruegeria]